MAVDKTTDSVAEGLKKVFTQVSSLMLLPDAGQHMQMLQGMQQIIMKYMQTVSQRGAQQAQGQQPGQQPSGGLAALAGGGAGQQGGMAVMAGPASPGLASPQPAQIAPGGGAGMSGFGSPNPDELRRVLQGASGQ